MAGRIDSVLLRSFRCREESDNETIHAIRWIATLFNFLQ